MAANSNQIIISVPPRIVHPGAAKR
ncbi:uncharacterized protein METZ01_LOCUS431731, partial [marine metagenome]